MEFIETRWFTRCVTELLPDDEYARLQMALIGNPFAGDLIPGGGGLRKMRWWLSGRGKRGGMRLIYYCFSEEQLIMLHAYRKNRQNDLTFGQLQALRAHVTREVCYEEERLPRIASEH